MQTLRTARKAAGLTQVQLAHRAGLHQQVVSSIEAGRVSSLKASWRVVGRLARALDVSPFQLFPVDEERAPAA